jgi:Tfp pilus assembly protein PilF
MAKAIDNYKRAIELDPNFALAYAAMAEVYNSMGKQYVLPKDCIPLAKAAATRALEIDPMLAERIRRWRIRWLFMIGIGRVGEPFQKGARARSKRLLHAPRLWD